MWRFYYIGLETVRMAVVFLPFSWLILRFAFHRKMKYIFWESIFGVYLLAVFAVVGFPEYKYLTVDFTANFIPFCDFVNSPVSYLEITLLNVLLFLPFGILFPVLHNGGSSFKKTVFLGFLLSLFIEIMQIFTLRATDVDDLIMNTLGAAAGFGIWHILRSNNVLREKLQVDCGKWELWIVFALAVVVKMVVAV